MALTTPCPGKAFISSMIPGQLYLIWDTGYTYLNWSISAILHVLKHGRCIFWSVWINQVAYLDRCVCVCAGAVVLRLKLYTKRREILLLLLPAAHPHFTERYTITARSRQGAPNEREWMEPNCFSYPCLRNLLLCVRKTIFIYFFSIGLIDKLLACFFCACF